MRVLLVFLEETLVSLPQVSSRDLEVLDDERLVLSSAITKDERLLELAPEPELAVLVYSSSSLLEHEETSSAMLIIWTDQDNKLFIFFLFIKC